MEYPSPMEITPGSLQFESDAGTTFHNQDLGTFPKRWLTRKSVNS